MSHWRLRLSQLVLLVLSALALPVWQLADDNRWRALITSSQRKMNSYPASSRAVFTARRGRQQEGEGEDKLKSVFSSCFLGKTPLPLSVTRRHIMQAEALRAAQPHFYGSEIQSADLVIINDCTWNKTGTSQTLKIKNKTGLCGKASWKGLVVFAHSASRLLQVCISLFADVVNMHIDVFLMSERMFSSDWFDLT